MASLQDLIEEKKRRAISAPMASSNRGATLNDLLAEKQRRQQQEQIPNDEYGNGITGHKRPIQYGQIGKDVLNVIPNTLSNLWEGVKGIPGAIGGAIDASSNPEGSAIQSLAAGAAQGAANLRNIPANVAEYGKTRGLLSREAASIFPRFEEDQILSKYGPKEPTKGDEFLINVGKLVPDLIAGRGLVGKSLSAPPKGHGLLNAVNRLSPSQKTFSAGLALNAAAEGEDPFAAAALPYAPGVIVKGVKTVGKGAASIPPIKNVKESFKAAKELTVAEEAKMKAKERLHETQATGNELKEAREAQKRIIEEKKLALAKRIAKEKEPALSSLESTAAELEKLAPTDVISSKREFVNELKKKKENEIEGPTLAIYEDIKKGAGKRPVIERVSERGISKDALEGTTTRKILDQVSQDEQAFKFADIALEDLKDHQWKGEDFADTLEEMSPKDLKEFNSKRKFYLDIIKKASKVEAPTVNDYMTGFRTARDEALHLRKMAASKDLNFEQKQNLIKASEHLDAISQRFEKAMRRSLTAEENALFDKAQKDYKELVLPFKQESFLRNAVHGTGKARTKNIYEALAGNGHDRLVRTLLADPEILNKLTKHDIRSIDISNPKAVEKFFKKRGEHVPERMKILSEEASKASKDLKATEEIEKLINASEIDLAAKAPEIERLFKRKPNLKHHFEDKTKETARLKEMDIDMEQHGVSENKRKEELNYYTDQIAELKSRSVLANVISKGSKAVAAILGAKSLFGGD